MKNYTGNTAQASFFNLHRHGFVRVAAAVPVVALSAPKENARRISALVEDAARQHVSVMVFPELCLSGYSNEDLFFQDILLSGVENAVEEICAATKEIDTLFFVGAPLIAGDGLYNCAVACQRGKILGVVPKSYLPNYREFYEKRYFRSGLETRCDRIYINDIACPFGTDILFIEENDAGLCIHAEICEDLWVPSPPSSKAAMAGANILVNLSASNATLGKSDKRHALCAAQSMRCCAAYLYTAAGYGESTTDLAWDGQSMIYENGTLLAQSERFLPHSQLLIRDIDLGLLKTERLRSNSFGDNRGASAKPMRGVSFEARLNYADDLGLRRAVDRFPYVPNDEAKLTQLCEEAYQIQVIGLAQRLESAGVNKLVVGISGGLDSTQALLVACRTMDRLNLPRTNILAYTLPAFATSSATKKNAWALMSALGVQAEEIDLSDASRQMLRDIAHPAAAFAGQRKEGSDESAQQYDITYENVQAGARTSLLFRLANHHRALVLGTGDLSELALGWCTYGVGDHMSHYNVNAAVSKTLIQHLIRWVVKADFFGKEAGEVCLRILDTDISPELIPADQTTTSLPVQLTEEIIGPYALQDFNLHHISRYGVNPGKVAFLAYHAWHDASLGSWPPNMKEADKNAYELGEIKKWLKVFLLRFFQTSQFKRSAMPNGPKMSSAGALSPRGDWRAPSDGSAAIWLEALERNVPGPQA